MCLREGRGERGGGRREREGEEGWWVRRDRGLVRRGEGVKPISAWGCTQWTLV